MAELNLGKGLTAGKVASNVQKKLTRAQEKVKMVFYLHDTRLDVAHQTTVRLSVSGSHWANVAAPRRVSHHDTSPLIQTPLRRHSGAYVWKIHIRTTWVHWIKNNPHVNVI